MFSSKGYIFAVLIAGFVLVGNIHCAPENIDSLPVRVRRSAQLPQIPEIPNIPSSIPGIGMVKNAGGFAKNIPGLDSLPGGIPRSARSLPETAADELDSMVMRNKREARGTGNLPTKTG